jgi:phage terminase large subunit
MINLETQIKLNRFQPRDYQLPICQAFENKGYKKLIVVLPRRAGKDIVCFNLMIRAALKRVGLYYYLLPTHVQARSVLFDGITSDGHRIIKYYIPEELIKDINIQQMKITLINDSIIQFKGSNDYDSLRGTNPVGVVMSEAAYSHPLCYSTVIRPILLNNDGWIIHISTPQGENHFHTLYEIAKNHPKEWFAYFKTVEDTQHISLEDIQAEIDSGEISPDMAQQEYFCSFKTGSLGAYYAKYVNNMELNNQIGKVDWEPNYPVYSAWDLGMSDATSILIFQVIGRQVNIIDMYQKSDVGLEHYINVLQAKPYVWGKHFGPHDLAVREFTSGGLTRLEKAAQLGFRFLIAPNISIIDGIECVRTTLPRVYIDEEKCKVLITALKNYRKEYDPETKTYKNRPYHDFNSHPCDAMRYLCLSLPKCQNTTSPEELNKRYNEAMYGDSDMPRFFKDDMPRY